MESKTIQDSNPKVQEAVLQRLPKWCKIILELKKEIEKEKNATLVNDNDSENP